MADDSRVLDALTTLVEKATGKNARPKVNWSTFKRDPIPDKVPPGYAVVSDRNGDGMQVVELFYICDSGRSAFVNPLEGRTRGPMVCGSLYPQIKGGELVVHQFTPYPQTRDDGLPHVTGQVAYPSTTNPGGWQELSGTFYSKSTARAAEMLNAAKGSVPVEKTSKAKE